MHACVGVCLFMPFQKKNTVQLLQRKYNFYVKFPRMYFSPAPDLKTRVSFKNLNHPGRNLCCRRHYLCLSYVQYISVSQTHTPCKPEHTHYTHTHWSLLVKQAGTRVCVRPISSGDCKGRAPWAETGS